MVVVPPSEPEAVAVTPPVGKVPVDMERLACVPPAVFTLVGSRSYFIGAGLLPSADAVPPCGAKAGPWTGPWTGPAARTLCLTDKPMGSPAMTQQPTLETAIKAMES